VTRKIILKQRQSPGDILTMTRAVSDLKRTYPAWLIDVRSPCPEIWENCPFTDRLDENDGTVESYDIGYSDINISGWNGLHYTEAFRNDIERKLNSHADFVEKWGKCEIVKTGYYPEIWISEEEKGWINQVETEFSWKGPFWLINAGRKPDNELKQYHKWQEVVDILNKFFDGRVKIVQVGHSSHIHPKLDGALSLVGKTDLRQYIRLAYWSTGLIGPLSFQFVLCAALRKPGVCVAGGKEGVPWHLYPTIQHIYTNGQLKCCSLDGCWKGGQSGACLDLVDGVPRCFQIIEPESIAEKVRMFYEGNMCSIPNIDS